jgi:hypothetical protein
MNDPRIDLSSLDPAKDPLRWERMIRSVAVRGAAGASRRRPGWLAVQLAAWVRPALACAAALALVAWVPTWLGHGTRAPADPSAGRDRAAALVDWAVGDQPVSALLPALGDDDDSR